MSTLYTKYYTGSDVVVTISGNKALVLDKLAGISFTESTDSNPYYGIGNTEFGFVNDGNMLVSGVIDINFTDPKYMGAALQYVLGYGDSADELIKRLAENPAATNNMDAENLRELRDKIRGASTQSVGVFGRGFNLQIMFNNSDLIHSDSAGKTIMIETCVILSRQLMIASGEERNLVERYQFIARKVK